MIIDFLISSMLGFIRVVFGILPSVPATPQSVIDGGQWITDQISAVISVLNMVYTPALLAATLIIIVGMFTFEWIYHTAMWIIRKVPFINIK